MMGKRAYSDYIRGSNFGLTSNSRYEITTTTTPTTTASVNATALTTTADTSTAPVCDSEILLKKKFSWIRCSPAEPYYIEQNDNTVSASEKLRQLQNRFEHELLDRAQRVRDSKPPYTMPPRKTKIHPRKHACKYCIS